MARLLTSPASLALFLSSGLATGSHGSNLLQLTRVQSVTFNIDDPKQDVVQIGSYSPIARERVEPPTVTMDFSYYVTGADNEEVLGFNVGGTQSFIKYILDKTKDERNYFVFVAPEGADAAGLNGADGKVKSFGNGFISSYSIQAAVGSLPTASVQVQLSNVVSHADGVSEQIPAIDFTTGLRATGITFTIPTVVTSWSAGGVQPSVIRPGDISMTLSSATGWFHNIQSGCVQSVNLSFDLNRQPVNCLGSTFPRSREIGFPLQGTLQVEMFPGDDVVGSLDQIICQTGVYTAEISFREPNCSGQGARALGFTLKGLTIDSQNWGAGVGDLGQTLSITYNVPLGGTGDTTRGVFASGITYRE